MLLDYPPRDGRWSWEELEVLAKALGYHEKIFFENVLPERRNNPYLELVKLNLLLEGDLLYPHLHKTFNHQGGTYNIKVILKATELLMQRYLSFSSLRMARVSFQTYEHTDHAGLEDRLVLRAMQLCGKTMSPLKFRHTVNHMARLVPDRLMLYEFLELLASADDITTVKTELPEKKHCNDVVGDRNLYDLCNFEDELSTQEQRYYRYLDQKYEDSRRILAIEESEEGKHDVTISDVPHQWAVPPLANPTIRKEMSFRNGIQSKILKTHVDSSAVKVKKRGCGSPCTCEAGLLSSLIETGENTSKSLVTEEISTNQSRSPITIKRLTSLVSEQDLEDTARKIENMQWEIATHGDKFRKVMDVPSSQR